MQDEQVSIYEELVKTSIKGNHFSNESWKQFNLIRAALLSSSRVF